jgi:hypothetical protein
MSMPFKITAPVIGHFDAKGIRHQARQQPKFSDPQELED